MLDQAIQKTTWDLIVADLWIEAFENYIFKLQKNFVFPKHK